MPEEEMEAEPTEEAQLAPAPEEERPAAPQRRGKPEPSGMSSVATGLETPGMVEIRKRREDEEEEPKSLYTVMPEVAVRALASFRFCDLSSAHLFLCGQTSVGGAFMGSTHKYVLPGSAAAAAAAAKTASGSNRVDIIRSQRTEGVDIALAPEDLEGGLDEAALKARFEKQEADRRTQHYADVSDVVAEETRKRQTKRKATGSESKKKQSDFKF